MILILPIVYSIICINTYSFVSKCEIYAKRRTSILIAGIIHTSLLLLITELLNFFERIDKWYIFISWLITFFINLTICYKYNNHKYIKEFVRVNYSHLAKHKYIAVPILIILIVTFITALLSAPNNYDSLTYHLPRVMYWIQQKSLNAYPTHIIRQLVYPPGAELSLIHIYILADSDRYLQLLQWLSFAGCLLCVTVIVRHFGYGLKSQVVSALLGATIPMAILQSTSTQNDLVASYFFMGFICFILFYYKFKHWIWYIFSCMSLGIAILTKAHIYLWTSGFILIAGIYLISTYKATVWKHGFIAVFILLAYNINYFIRNIKLMNIPIGEGDMSVKATNEVFGLPYLFLNVIRNIGIHLTLPNNAITSLINDFITRGIKFCHTLLNVSFKDERIFYYGDSFSGPRTWLESEDVAGNPIHGYLILAIIIISIYNIKRIKPIYKYYVGGLIFGGLMFCFYLKWMVWHNRMHLPFFISMSPIIGITIVHWFKPFFLKFSLFLLVSYSMLPLFFNINHIWISKNNIFTLDRNKHYMLDDEKQSLKFRFSFYQHIIESIRNESKENTIGLYINMDTAEYPFWALLNISSFNKYTFSHVGVYNLSAKTSTDKSKPEIIITEKKLHEERPLNLLNTGYKKMSSNDLFEMYKIQ